MFALVVERDGRMLAAACRVVANGFDYRAICLVLGV